MSIYKIIITPKVEAIASDYIQKMKPDSNSDNYVQNRIKDIIISTRKQALLNNLEKELLSDALDKETLIIY